MKKKTIAAAALCLALAPCVLLFGCTDTDKTGGNKPGVTNQAAATKLDGQVKGAKDTYTNIYNRAERNGGFFTDNSAPDKSASAVRYMLTADGEENEDGGDGETEGENGSESKFYDTNELISRLLSTIKTGKYSLPASNVVQTYVLDTFAYTQIASAIVNGEGKKALACNYSVDYDYDADFQQNMIEGPYWRPNIPEEMSFAGFDESSSKVNLVFSARNPNDKKNGVEKFEKVNSEMYYISDNDFGYAQFTYRKTSTGENETGFNYFSMKDKVMLEINLNAAGKLTFLETYDYTAPLYSLSDETKQAVETILAELENVFTERTNALEQQNLALAKEAGIENIETKTENGKTVYVKGKSENAYKVSFDYSVLKNMRGR